MDFIFWGCLFCNCLMIFLCFLRPSDLEVTVPAVMIPIWNICDTGPGLCCWNFSTLWVSLDLGPMSRRDVGMAKISRAPAPCGLGWPRSACEICPVRRMLALEKVAQVQLWHIAERRCCLLCMVGGLTRIWLGHDPAQSQYGPTQSGMAPWQMKVIGMGLAGPGL